MLGVSQAQHKARAQGASCCGCVSGLTYRDVRAVLTWLADAFGLESLFLDSANAIEVHHAALLYREAMVLCSSPSVPTSCTAATAFLRSRSRQPDAKPRAPAGRGAGPAPRSDCGVVDVAAVGGDRPDNEDIQGDDEQRPERVGDEQEVGDGAEQDHGDSDGPGPGAARQQPPSWRRPRSARPAGGSSPRW